MKPRKTDVFKFYLKREGLLGVLIEWFYAKQLISYETLMRFGIIRHRRSAYFSGMTPDQFRNEIVEYARVFSPYGKKFNIDNPKGFNEKIQWLILHEDNEIKARLADKYLVKEWVKSKIGDECIIRTIAGPWDNAEQIDFERLPDRFVLKTNHASGTNLVVLNKETLNIKRARKQLNRWLNMPYGYIPYEPQYLLIKPCIFAEEYIEQDNGELLDYKVFCFNGAPKFFRIIINEKGGRKQALYDGSWNRMDCDDTDYPEYEGEIAKPEQFDRLVNISKRLAEGFRFVRVDMYIIGDSIKFGEMTFTPNGGFEEWKRYEETDMFMGNELDLSYEGY